MADTAVACRIDSRGTHILLIACFVATSSNASVAFMRSYGRCCVVVVVVVVVAGWLAWS